MFIFLGMLWERHMQEFGLIRIHHRISSTFKPKTICQSPNTQKWVAPKTLFVGTFECFEILLNEIKQTSNESDYKNKKISFQLNPVFTNCKKREDWGVVVSDTLQGEMPAFQSYHYLQHPLPLFALLPIAKKGGVLQLRIATSCSLICHLSIGKRRKRGRKTLNCN